MGDGPLRGLRAAVSFLTRVPAGPPRSEPSDLARGVPWFPVVGALVGLVLAGTYAAFLTVLPSLPASGVTIGVGLLLTGALHEDGLADSADALGGGRSREEALGILKDPAHGTYGVLAIVLSVVLRIAALAGLDAWTALAILPGAHALSRGAAAAVMGWLPPATDEGLGASYAAITSRGEVTWAVVATLAVGLISLGGWVVLAIPLAVLAAGIVALISVRRIGGITGDVLGAAQQAVEVVLVLLGAAAIAGGWPSATWWR
jgi:adenosylcobinamide-GDP ribazoletransferase